MGKNKKQSRPSTQPQTTLLTQDYLKELAKDKKNKVYQYEYSEPKYNFTAAQRQVCMRDIWNAYTQWKQTHVADYKKWDGMIQAGLDGMIELKQKQEQKQISDDECDAQEDVLHAQIKEGRKEIERLDQKARDLLRKQNQTWKEFSVDHAKTFWTLTSYPTSHEDIMHLRYMVYLQMEQEKGNITEGEAQEMVQGYLIRKFRTNQTLEAYKKDMADRERRRKEKAARKQKRKQQQNK